MKQYAIYNPNESAFHEEPMYWSNEYGWVSFDEATIFTEEEKEKFNSAIGGRWVEVRNTNPLWDNNLIQFARLICEINATCNISKKDWSALKESMDLEDHDINELFDRANELWENHKQGHFAHQY